MLDEWTETDGQTATIIKYQPFGKRSQGQPL